MSQRQSRKREIHRAWIGSVVVKRIEEREREWGGGGGEKAKICKKFTMKYIDAYFVHEEAGNLPVIRR